MCPSRYPDAQASQFSHSEADARSTLPRCAQGPSAWVKLLTLPLRRLAKLGIDPRPLLEKHGLPHPMACDEATRIGQAALCDFWDACARVSGDPAFGLHVSLQYLEQVVPSMPTVLHHLTRHADTLGDAIAHAVRYERLCQEGRRGELVVDGERATWRLQATHGVRFSRVFSEHVLAYLARPAHWANRNPAQVELLEVHFPLSAPDDRREYDAHFRVPLRFDCGYQALVFSRKSLEARSMQGDPTLVPLLRRVAEEELARVPSFDLFSERVRARLAEDSMHGPVSLTTMARKLGLGERTLRRRLSEENTSYYELVDEWRKGRAQQLVCNRSRNIMEAAALLGYAEQNSFARAYRRWFGTSPGEDRKRALHATLLSSASVPRATRPQLSG
jgi:AraC-like DNA-binding protein